MMHATTQNVLNALEGITGFSPKRNGKGWLCHCPAHDDHDPSLSVHEGEKGVLLKCFGGCDLTLILAILGMSEYDLFYDPPSGNGRRAHDAPVAQYNYVNESGDVLYQVCRLSPKRFLQCRPDPARPGEWLWKLGDTRRVLYNLPHVLETVALEKWVFVCEGEKDADNLASLGVCATTNAGGVGGVGQWRDEGFKVPLCDARVVILPDNDPPGRKHAEQVAASLHGVVREIKVIHLPGLPDKGDVSDWLGAGHTLEELQVLVEAAEPWTPTATPSAAEDTGDGDGSISGDVEAVKGRELTELATARRLKAHHGEDLRHAKGLGWLVWDKKRWAQSEKAAERYAHKMGDAIRAELKGRGTNDGNVAKAYYQHAKAIERAAGVSAVLSLAKALDDIDADNAAWDSHPWLLNCPNGTVDLRTGELMKHSREHHITKLCPTPYNPDATAPRWLQFLLQIFDGDADVADYFQWVMGYALTGSVAHDLFFILHGRGENGKSTTMETLRHVWGMDYAQQINPEELLAQKYARHTTELAALRGARLVVAQESPENRRLNESLVKALTGGDTIRARFMHRDSFEFAPEFKLFLSTNHRPGIRDDSRAMWRRVRLLPFEVSFPPTDPRCDPHLDEKLRTEAAGILAWAVAGAQLAQDGEPPLPGRVKAATKSYQTEQDVVAAFLEDECEVFEGAMVGMAELYRAYQGYTGGRCETKTAFNRRLRERGYTDGKAAQGKRVWKGLALITETAPDLYHAEK